jgi:hypothetical protein
MTVRSVQTLLELENEILRLKGDLLFRGEPGSTPRFLSNRCKRFSTGKSCRCCSNEIVYAATRHPVHVVCFSFGSRMWYSKN